MHQIKIFKALEVEVDTLERQVNAWLASSKARVISITGNIAPQSEAPGGRSGGGLGSAGNASDVLLVVLYEIP